MSELIIERNFAAKPKAVFEFITKGEHLHKWWGPEGITIAENDLDFTEIGPWSSVMVNADGKRALGPGDIDAAITCLWQAWGLICTMR